jgi:hypothetical protein
MDHVNGRKICQLQLPILSDENVQGVDVVIQNLPVTSELLRHLDSLKKQVDNFLVFILHIFILFYLVYELKQGLMLFPLFDHYIVHESLVPHLKNFLFDFKQE